MQKRCRFCGEKIKADKESCPQCGKTLIVKPKDEDSETSLVGLSKWEGKTIPVWMMILILGIVLFSCYTMLSSGCDQSLEDQILEDQQEARLQELDLTGNQFVVSGNNLQPFGFRDNR